MFERAIKDDSKCAILKKDDIVDKNLRVDMSRSLSPARSSVLALLYSSNALVPIFFLPFVILMASPNFSCIYEGQKMLKQIPIAYHL